MKMLINGVEKEVERIPVKMAAEPWGESLLDNGDIIRIRVIITAIYRVVDELGVDGKPIYQIQSQTVVAVN